MTYLFRNSYIYWSDASTDQVFRSRFDGSGVQPLANASHEDIGEQTSRKLIAGRVKYDVAKGSF